MKVTKQQIESFLQGKQLAIAGVSRSEKKFGHKVFTELMAKGHKVIPVNPNAEKIDGEPCYKTIGDLPPGVDSLLILTPKDQTDNILREAIQKGIKNIWVQQMSETEESLRIAEEYDKEIIFGKCIFMFAEPVGSIHRFHRAIVKLFGGLPK
jgi:predicted CoA-binding protein